tara:strand:- start:401 stop:526 length:126 start_codon:yes stop_codon:yes gene_type:complete
MKSEKNQKSEAQHPTEWRKHKQRKQKKNRTPHQKKLKTQTD